MTLRKLIADRLPLGVDAHRLQREFAPQLSYGRHRGPARWNMREAAVLVLLCEVGDDIQLPMIVRPSEMLHHAGQTCFPGGAADPGESAEETALREASEEIALKGGSVELLGRLSPVHVFASNYRVTPVLAACAGWPEFSANPAEVEKILPVSLVSLQQASARGEHWIERAGVSFRTPHLAACGERIWGASCMILAELLALLD